MKFYNRERELDILEKAYNASLSESVITIISGRRRIGKTELLRQFGNSKENFLYFFVSRKTIENLLEEYRDEIARIIPYPVGKLSLEQFLELIFDLGKEKHLIVAFDEFQNFKYTSPEAFSLFQKYFDLRKRDSKVHLIFSGSSFTLMQKIFTNYKEPLFGRADFRIHLKEFEILAITEILKDYKEFSPSRLLSLYALFGGVPKYYALMEKYNLFGKSTPNIILNLYLDEDAPLREEGKEILIEEFGKEYWTYFSILQVIASGETKPSKIGSKLGFTSNKLSKYLDRLINYYGLLEKRIPVFSKPSTRNGRYYIRDNFLRFWFRYIWRFSSALEIKKQDPVMKYIKKDFRTFIGKVFENLIKKILSNSEEILPFTPSEIGSFWNRNGNEIDIVATDEENLFLGECKLSGKKLGRETLIRLKNKGSFISKRGKRMYGFFVLNDVEKARKNLKGEKVYIFSLENLLPVVN